MVLPFDESEKQFIKANIEANPDLLLLKKGKTSPIRIKELGEQIKSRQKIKEKLPSWYTNIEVQFPATISLEQSSSELTANYKSNLISGKTVIDLTGGMGIDISAISKNFEKAIYIERNEELTEISKHNFTVLNLNNITCHHADGIEFITNTNEIFDWIYLDPARRSNHGEKIVSLADCEPNILANKALLFKKSKNILMKCSPMLDIDLAKRELENVAKIHIVSVDNEVKEILFSLKKDYYGKVETIVTSIVNKIIEEHFFDLEFEKSLTAKIGSLKKYLYEPNAGIMKAGVFKSICEKYACQKLHANTNLYTSDKLIADFPGRKFEIIKELKANKSAIKEAIPKLKANLTIRNFPGKVSELRDKLKLKDGGNVYLFACTNNKNEKIILQTIKIQ